MSISSGISSNKPTTPITEIVGTPNTVVITNSAGNAETVTTFGTSGNVLTSTGSTSAPTFQAPSGGGVSSVNTRAGAVTLVGTDIPAFVASGGSHAAGAVPDPGSSVGTTRFLREDATWVAPAGSGTVTGGANEGGGAASVFDSSGSTSSTLKFKTITASTAINVNDSGTLLTLSSPTFVASGSSHAPGSVPDPGSSAGSTKFLREDATWAVPAGGGGSVSSVNTRTGTVTLVGTDIPAFVASGGSHAAGAVPDPGSTAGTARFLREDATFDVPVTFQGDSGNSAASDIFLLCDDVTTTSPKDSSGNNIAFTGTNLTSVAGKFNNAFSFNGSSSFLESTSTNPFPQITTGNSFSFACWINTTTTGDSCLMELADGSNFTGNVFLFLNDTLQGGTVGSVSFNLYTGSGYVVGSQRGSFTSVANTLNDGSWHFIVAIKTPTLLKLYIDNVFDSSASCTDTSTGTNLFLAIGHHLGASQYYSGSMDEIQVYPRALSTGDINTLYTSGYAGFGPIPTVGYVPAPSIGDGALGKLLTAGGSWGYPAVSGTPANSSATGTAGEIKYDTNYIYVCTATNTWGRAALSSF